MPREIREIRIVAVSGAISNPSKTTALARTIARRAEVCIGGAAVVHDVAALQHEIGASLIAGELTPVLREVVTAIEEADLLIAASPVFNGGYSGLFKHLFDLIDPGALRDTPVVLAATGGTERHTLVIDYEMRPLFQYFHALMASSSIYATGADFRDYQVVNPAIHERIDEALESLCPHVRRRATVPRLIEKTAS